MTIIDVNTSPLQAAREWRGVTTVSAALQAGLTVAQVEALEAGDRSAFSNTNELIGAAVVYGASLGIGREEAVALLDRTILGSELKVDLSDMGDSRSEKAELSHNESFSNAVKERSARIHGQSSAQIIVEPIAAPEQELDTPAMPSSLETELPDVPSGPTPEQAVEASNELNIEPLLDEISWESSSDFDEVDGYDDDYLEDDQIVSNQRSRIGAAIGARSYALTERIVGTDHADRAASGVRTIGRRIESLFLSIRDLLKRSEHATLIVAIGGGALLIALLVAIGGAVGSKSDKPADKTAKKTQAAQTQGAPIETSPKISDGAQSGAPKVNAKTAAKPAALIPPRRITVNVYNAGSKKGYAKQVADKVKGLSYKVGAVENTSDSYTMATVIYPKGMQREAQILARKLGIGTLKTAPGSGKKITVVVI